MDYGKILSRSWAIVWGNKWMFVLGFLAALGSGGGSGGRGGNSGSGFNVSGDEFGADFPFNNFNQGIEEWVPYIIAVGCILFVIGIILWLLRLVGEAGMIASVDRLESGEKMSLGAGFSAGTTHLVSMVGLSLLLSAPFLLVGLVIAGGAISLGATAVSGLEETFASGFGLAAICLIPLFCILAIAGIVVAFIYPMAQRGIIIEGYGVVDGIRRGWQVLKDNLGEIFLLGIIFALIGFFIGIISLVVALPLALVFLVPAFLTAVEGSAAITAATIGLGVVGLIVFVLLAAAVGSILRAFQSTAFTLAYHQWTGKSFSEKEIDFASDMG